MNYKVICETHFLSHTCQRNPKCWQVFVSVRLSAVIHPLGRCLPIAQCKCHVCVSRTARLITHKLNRNALITSGWTPHLHAFIITGIQTRAANRWVKKKRRSQNYELMEQKVSHTTFMCVVLDVLGYTKEQVSWYFQRCLSPEPSFCLLDFVLQFCHSSWNKFSVSINELVQHCPVSNLTNSF